MRRQSTWRTLQRRELLPLVCNQGLQLHFSWIQVRVDLISDLVVFAFIVFAVVMGNRQLVTLGVVALVIDSCITFCGYASGIARMWRDVEVEIVSIERVCEYIRNKHEAPWRYPTSRVPPSWPVHGRIVFQDLCLRYRPDDDLVLKSINLAVEGSQRVGVVGRTGAGRHAPYQAPVAMYGVFRQNVTHGGTVPPCRTG